MKVSIIMPVYNCERFIADSINSVLSQTYTNFELIIIDDGSKDNSRKIIKEYALKDERIKAFYNENHGVSYTRNYGIDHADGEYIAFIDADDIYKKRYLEEMCRVITDENADLVCCDYEMGYSLSDWKINNKITLNLSKQFNEKAFEYASEIGVGVNIWTKLFSKEIINRFEYP